MYGHVDRYWRPLLKFKVRDWKHIRRQDTVPLCQQHTDVQQTSATLTL